MSTLSASNITVSGASNAASSVYNNTSGYAQVAPSFSTVSDLRLWRMRPPRTSLRLRWSMYQGSTSLRKLRNAALHLDLSGTTNYPNTVTPWAPQTVPYTQPWGGQKYIFTQPTLKYTPLTYTAIPNGTFVGVNTGTAADTSTYTWTDYLEQTAPKSLDLVVASVSDSESPSWSKTLNLESTRTRTRA